MIRCNNCMTEFKGQHELKLFVEAEKAADDVYTVPYNPDEDYGENYIVFGACPKCETDAYLIDLEEEK